MELVRLVIVGAGCLVCASMSLCAVGAMVGAAAALGAASRDLRMRLRAALSWCSVLAGSSDSERMEITADDATVVVRCRAGAGACNEEAAVGIERRNGWPLPTKATGLMECGCSEVQRSGEMTPP